MKAPGLAELLATWRFDPATAILLLVLGGGYVLAVRRYRGARGRRPWPLRRTLAFLAGVAALALALGSGIEAFSGRMLSALADQRAAAALMWLGGGTAMMVALIVLAARWMAEDERRARARDSRRWATAVGTMLCAGASALLATPEPAPAQVRPAPSAERGRGLFVDGCSSCHGIDARGIPGRGPSLHGAGAAAADFYLSTGRMPLPAPGEQPLRGKPAYPPDDVDALVAYVASLAPGPTVPAVRPERGDLAEGRELFASRCAGCHQIAGAGGIVTGAAVPDFEATEPVQVGEAVRVGPYLMPRWSERAIDPAELDSLTRFVMETKKPRDDGGWGIGHIGPIPEGMVAWLIAGAALLLVVRLIGERTPE